MRLAALALLTFGSAGLAHAAPAPFTATYAVSRDGKVIGESNVRLADSGNGEWTMTTETRGTAGMARMLGLDVREESRFRWSEGRPEALSYDFRQDLTLKHKQRHAEFDWRASEAQVRDGDKSYHFPVTPGTMDRHSVSLAIGDALTAGRRELQFAVAAKDHVEQQQYKVAGEEELSVPAGRYRTLKVERTDAPGKIRSWYAVDQSPVPVRLEQAQGDGSLIVLELRRSQ
jgi:hypothetical protein